MNGATAINDRGQIVGWISTPTSRSHAALWHNGTPTDLGTLAAGRDQSSASAVNDAGQVAGSSWTGDFPDTTNEHAVLWENGKMRDLGTLPGGHQSTTHAINDKGVIVGESDTANGTWHAVLSKNGQIRDLGVSAIGDSGATGINDRGQIVGYFTNSRSTSSPSHVFLLSAGKRLVLPTLGDTQNAAAGINEHGQIVGRAATKGEDGHAVL